MQKIFIETIIIYKNIGIKWIKYLTVRLETINY